MTSKPASTPRATSTSSSSSVSTIETIFRLTSNEIFSPTMNKEFSIFESRPADKERIQGGLILIQEIFGVNSHIKSVARQYAEAGYVTWAPQYFDHVQRDVEFPYDNKSMVRGRELGAKTGWDQALADTRLSAEELKKHLPTERNKVGALGFCWGGSLAWLAACRLGHPFIDAAVCYYGRQTWDFRNESPRTPIILHFGEHDPLIPLQNIRDFEAAHPQLPVYLYNAGHGFNRYCNECNECNECTDYNPEAATLAKTRTLEFLITHLSSK